MARNETWTNKDGVDVGFGTRTSYNAEGGIVHSLGRVKEIEINLNTETHGDVASGSYSSKEMTVPAGALIRSARVNVTTAITGATDFTVGLKDTVDGTAIDADGLITSAESLLTVGVVDGAAGALLNTVTTADAAVNIDVTGVMTDGEATIFVTYEEAVPSQAPAGILDSSVEI